MKTINDVLHLVRENILSLAPYSTARDEYEGDLGIFLDANENPFENGYNRYPDPGQRRLKGIISKIKEVNSENIFVGNGSDEAIDLCYRIFCRPGIDNAIAIAPSYGMYKVAAAINDIEMREVPLSNDFNLSVESVLSLADENSKLLFLCSPNNPSGNSLEITKLVSIIEDFNGVVVVDEAYIDFASQPSLLTVLDSHPNLIILQTLSKAFGLAGLRLGLAFAGKEIMHIFAQVKYPYNINSASLEKAYELLKRDFKSEVEIVVSERKRVEKAIKDMNSVLVVYPSDANFILIKVRDAGGLYKSLIDKKIIVRDRSKIKGCESCLRITIGTPEENDKMLKIVEQW